MQFHHASEELPFGEPLNVRSAWEVRARVAVCPCSCPLIGVLRSRPCSNLLADQGVMATAAIFALQIFSNPSHRPARRDPVGLARNPRPLTFGSSFPPEWPREAIARTEDHSGTTVGFDM
jgi:hypothetical protein